MPIHSGSDNKAGGHQVICVAVLKGRAMRRQLHLAIDYVREPVIKVVRGYNDDKIIQDLIGFNGQGLHLDRDIGELGSLE